MNENLEKAEALEKKADELSADALDSKERAGGKKSEGWEYLSEIASNAAVKYSTQARDIVQGKQPQQ